MGTVPDDTDPESDVWLASSSLGFFINAKLFMSLNILLGIPVVLMPTPLDEFNISIIKRHLVTFILVFPPLAAKLAKSDFNPMDVTSVKWLLSAGATIPRSLRESLLRKFPQVDLTLEWGTTETMLIAIQTSKSSTRYPGSSGTLVNGMQARVICTEMGTECGAMERGEILVRNALAPFKGYLDDEEANRDFDADGWFHTGDYGYLDSDCNVYIIDRLKELLRVGDGHGSRVSASEIEDAVFTHPAVGSVIVVGVYNSKLAVEEPTAFVVPTQGSRGSAGRELARDILYSVSPKLTGLMKLTGGVYLVDEFPMTGFKIDRKALKELRKDEESRTVGCKEPTRRDSGIGSDISA